MHVACSLYTDYGDPHASIPFSSNCIDVTYVSRYFCVYCSSCAKQQSRGYLHASVRPDTIGVCVLSPRSHYPIRTKFSHYTLFLFVRIRSMCVRKYLYNLRYYSLFVKFLFCERVACSQFSPTTRKVTFFFQFVFKRHRKTLFRTKISFKY